MNVSLFRNRNFVLFLIRESLSLSGTIFLNISLALYILALTGSATQFASVLSLAIIPHLILGPLAGVIVDRMNKRTLILILESGRAFCLFMLFVSSLLSPIQAEVLYICVILFSACDVFAAPAYVTLMPSIVKKEELNDANALDTTIVETVRVLAPFLGTVVYSQYGISTVFLIHAVLCLFSVAATCLIVIPQAIKKDVASTILHDMKTGLQSFTQDKRIFSLVLNGMLTHLFLFPFVLLGFPFLIKQVFLGSDLDFGLVESLQTAGSLCSITGVMLLQKRYTLPVNIGIGIIGLIVFVCPLLFLVHPGFFQTLQHQPLLVVGYFGAVSFLLFFAFGTYGVFFRTFYQQTIDSIMLGRFVSVMAMLFAISRFAGFHLYGKLFDSYPLLYPIVILGIGMMLKLLMHIPFLQDEKKRKSQQAKCATSGSLKN
ncbi:MFS transporter [Brevibacillus reuszeri]|uniref:MFS transporter n=1 Tax=Brevibacillus reuszeri TaxID=54915 RepID=A0A0K9YX89_9BACL|nr:MFS transporter [Brevibacillus reuszeri]KNB73308.1 hypothetical protein ADS79_04925 [Brevibacillus reuszeri]MED1856927.1 MFS transporter [Brevibacillus reuszeri]GED68324.1 MFS transporter [Brevibacillus reuszeri]